MKKVLPLVVLSVLLLQSPTGSTVSAQTATPNLKIAQSDPIRDLELSVHNQINQYRQSRNLPSLKFDEKIAEQARAHSIKMLNSNTFNHDGFNQRVKAIDTTDSNRGASENIASNSGYRQPDKTAVQDWIDSPRHHQNLTGDYNLTGVGIAKNGSTYIFTQIFINLSE
jgi:uncharacterized protein YkwD